MKEGKRKGSFYLAWESCFLLSHGYFANSHSWSALFLKQLCFFSLLKSKGWNIFILGRILFHTVQSLWYSTEPSQDLARVTDSVDSFFFLHFWSLHHLGASLGCRGLSQHQQHWHLAPRFCPAQPPPPAQSFAEWTSGCNFSLFLSLPLNLPVK